MTIAFASAGAWQLGRGAAKEAMLERSERVLARQQAMPLSIAADVSRAAGYDWSAGTGRFPAAPPLLLDNQQRNGRVGVRVYRVLHVAPDSEMLVDFGWVPWSRDRQLPDLSLPVALRDRSVPLRGLLAPPPSSGIAMGAPMADQTVGPSRAPAWLATRIELAAVDQHLGDRARALAPRVLRLDPTLPIGYERDLVLLANTLPPEKHRGYAVQWFGLALATLATALILTFRRPRR